MWLWILLIIALIAAAFIFTASWMLVKLVITPERSSLEEVEQLEIERGNFAPGEMAAMVPDEEGSIIARDGVRLDYAGTGRLSLPIRCAYWRTVFGYGANRN